MRQRHRERQSDRERERETERDTEKERGGGREREEKPVVCIGPTPQPCVFVCPKMINTIIYNLYM